MSTEQNEIDDKNLLSTSIKYENNTDDYLVFDKQTLKLNGKKGHSNRSSMTTVVIPSQSFAYKGKIEVTSKGRRKIFDGVRWQILCRRPGLMIIYFLINSTVHFIVLNMCSCKTFGNLY